MMKCGLMTIAAACLLAGPVLGNGGGYSRGGVEHTGSVAGFEPSGTEKIRILDERLSVSLGPDEAQVEVRYLMRNESKKRVKVRFGFPVEESFDEEFMTQVPTQHDEPQYCRDYRVSASGQPLKVKFRPETERKDPRFVGLRGWLVSEMSFHGGEEKPVLIRFHSVYPESVFSVSEDGRESAKLFRYRLSTGACWAGTIGTGRVVLRPNGIDPQELRVLKPVNRFRKEGDTWVWNFENLEPTMADDLEVEAVPDVWSYGRTVGKGEDGRRVSYIERGGRWMMKHRNFTVKASSTLPPDGDLNYGAGNINDTDWENTWSEGAPGPGVGEWLEIRPEVAKPLAAVNLMPGYAKSEALFRANARPKRIKVELNGEHAFTTTIPDQKEWCWIPVRRYDKPVRVLKLTIEEVWKGERFEDMCLSYLRLVVKLDKKPEITPAR